MSEPDAVRRHALTALAAAAAATALSSCGGEDGSAIPSPTPQRTRTWRMGFSPNPPRPTVQAVLQGIDTWSTRAELAIIHEELPWADLLVGMTPDAILDRDKVGLVNYLRGKGLGLFFMLDLTDGLSRAEEARPLRNAGRSLSEPAVQQLVRAYALAVERRLTPEYLGLAAETNLIRAAAPAAVYQAVKQVANATHLALTNAGAASRRFVSIQVETAWGRLGGATGPYVGVEQDFTDFPFTQALGLSSYPYLAYTQPEALPGDYYSRLRGGRNTPVLITEGGWSSASVPGFSSSPDAQARYITRHADLLDSVSALAYFQLQFPDVDLSSVPPPVPVNLPLFAAIGLADTQFAAKPALASWDALFRRQRL
jgi:hypothetical protein